MRRTAPFWASQLLNVAGTAFVPTAGINGYRSGVSGLFFADRAVKMTHVNTTGCSFTCTPSVLSCKRSNAAAVVRLVTDETGCVPVARVLIVGKCYVSLFRSRRVVFFCAGEGNREQQHEITLKRGDVLAVFNGCDLLRDWTSVERTWRSVADEDLEYIAEEMLLELNTGARIAINGDHTHRDEGNGAGHGSCKKEYVSSGTCIMAAVRNKSSAKLPQPPASMHCPM